MTSEVYFAQRRATQGGGLLEKLEQLCDAAGFAQLIGSGDLVALKVPFGEVGNTTHLRQQYLQRIVRRVKHYGGRPFLTDTVPAAPSPRQNAVDALLAAAQHGFAMSTVEAPILLADGLLVEAHPEPDKALSDGPQTIDFPTLEKLLAQLRQLAPMLGRAV